MILPNPNGATAVVELSPPPATSPADEVSRTSSRRGRTPTNPDTQRINQWKVNNPAEVKRVRRESKDRKDLAKKRGAVSRAHNNRE
jgi:hypothetical protein